VVVVEEEEDEEAEEAVAEEEAVAATQRETERRTRPWRLMSDAVSDSASCFARPEEGNCVCETLKAAHRKGAGVSH
jgi:hypothetical protein